MTTLVLSHSHPPRRFMRQRADTIRPDVLVHLGDYFDDAVVLKEEYPQILVYQVPGNCDRYRCPPGLPEILVENICGVRVYMTHGHRHQVKMSIGLLLKDARAAKADIVLYGHTHAADCHREDDGLWVMNPGSCGYYGGSAGIIEIVDGKMKTCKVIREKDLL